MDIANVVFVCGRQIRPDDPLLEVANAMYCNTVERFSFSFFKFLVLTWRAFESARLPNLYIAGSETSVFILGLATKVVFLSCASWFCQLGSSHI